MLFSAMPTHEATAFREGAMDANRQPPERLVSDGGGNPCRHCLRDIPEGAGMLLLAWRPFPEAQPYAETGPIFLCLEACDRHPDSETPPELLARCKALLVRGYGQDDRIVYDTGQIVPTEGVIARCESLLGDPRVAYVHLRSASNNCFLARVNRVDQAFDLVNQRDLL